MAFSKIFTGRYANELIASAAYMGFMRISIYIYGYISKGSSRHYTERRSSNYDRTVL
jgi:hypothetical protein